MIVDSVDYDAVRFSRSESEPAVSIRLLISVDRCELFIAFWISNCCCIMIMGGRFGGGVRYIIIGSGVERGEVVVPKKDWFVKTEIV